MENQIEYDTIIIGGGLAGLTAAFYTLETDKKMLLIEKCAKIGGNSSKFYIKFLFHYLNSISEGYIRNQWNSH